MSSLKKKKIGKFTLIGNSMGGAISINYSYLYPEKLNNKEKILFFVFFMLPIDLMIANAKEIKGGPKIMNQSIIPRSL